MLDEFLGGEARDAGAGESGDGRFCAAMGEGRSDL